MYINKQNKTKHNLSEEKSETIQGNDKKGAEDSKTETNVENVHKSSRLDLKSHDPNTYKEMMDVELNGYLKDSSSDIKSGVDIFMNDPLNYKPGEYYTFYCYQYH